MGAPTGLTKTVVVLQGGGPLGAFGCGAWQVLAPWLRSNGHQLVAVGGASIGALNAAAIACNAGNEDLGAGALLTIWCDRIATFMPRLAAPSGMEHAPWGTLRDEFSAWSGWLFGVTLGNRALFTPLYAHWNPAAGMKRAAMPLYSQQPMRRTLRDIVGTGYGAGGTHDPLLGVAATDVLNGRLQLFSSDDAPIDVSRLSASAAIPLMFEPVEVEGRQYCDGEMNRCSMVPMLIETVLASGRVVPGDSLQLISIGQFCRPPGRQPMISHELIDRTLQLLLADKLAGEQPTGVARHIEIARTPEPFDSVSGQFDYSSARIRALIESGRAAAREQLGATVKGAATGVADKLPMPG